MDLANKNLALLFEISGIPVYLTQSLLSTWIVMAVLTLGAIFARIKMRSFSPVPSGFQNFIEFAVEAADNMVKSAMGDGFGALGGYFFSILAFILASNYTALLGLRPPTSDISTTLSLALLSMGIMHFLGISRRGMRYFKEYFEPVWAFFPMHLMEDLTKPISLSFRLFGNILGGVIIFELIYELFPFPLRFVIPSFLHAYFDLFVGALQAYIFTTLSITFMSQKASAN
ncbi:MAG: F0F1 ATP synthase subunit A [Synergistaceae bacterium]|jgi:F-type H+-transporting ATPase subunit a|nr:F0F1 ATP synthase subunit A [Synergistaceae bacterium]